MKPYVNSCPAKNPRMHVTDVAMAMVVLILAILVIGLFTFSTEFHEILMSIESTLLRLLR
jgi:hypothetical protein